MKQFLFLVLMLLSTALTAQDFTTKLEHPNNYSNYDFFTFPNTQTNEVYAVAFHLSNMDNTSGNILWTINTKTNETKLKSIPRYSLNDVREVRDMFFYNNHIFFLKLTGNNQILTLQPLPVADKANRKPQLISLTDGNEQFLASNFVGKDFYIFTASRKKRIFKIYKIDLNKEEIDMMEVNMPREDILTFRIGNIMSDERYYTRVIDHKEFNHPNQLLVENKIYIEEDKIVLLQQSLNSNQKNRIYQIDFEAKTFDRKEIGFSHSNTFFNSVYHKNYIYRFSGSHSNMTVEAISLIPENKTLRYTSNKDMKTFPFQTSLAKKITFNRENENPIITSYQSGKLFKKPFTGFGLRTLGLIEEQGGDATFYVGFTPLTTAFQAACTDPDIDINGLSLHPHLLNYYFIETNLSPTSNASYDATTFTVPNFAKVIAKCQKEELRVRIVQPIEQRFLVKNEVAGVQVHRLEDGFYGTYFNRKTNEFGLKKLVDFNLVE